MSASSTLPRTNTCSMSPSVMTSVAFAPRFRIDDTGLPISTARDSTVPRIGALRVVGAVPVLRQVHQAVGVVERRLRDEALLEEHLRPVVGAAGELFLRPF